MASAGFDSLSRSRRTELTIPRTTVDRIVDQLLSNGRVTRGYIGIGGQPVMIAAALGEKLKIPENRGLLVITVADGRPADKAGLAVGDIILSIEGSSVAEPADLLSVLEPETVGKTLRVRVLRGGTPADFNVTIGERKTE